MDMREEDIDFVLKRYKDLFGFDLSYIRFKTDSQPVYTNGDPCYEYDFDECAGDWTKLGWIRLNPDMRSVMRRYGVDGDVKEFTRVIIAHELAHELWNGVANEDFKRDVLSKAESENFSTPYLETVRPSKLREETFCEWMANAVVYGNRSMAKPTGLMETRLCRFTAADGQGVYQALKDAMSPAEWQNFLKSDAATWLPRPGKYPPGAESYFTPKGRRMFVKKTLPVIKDFVGGVKEVAAPRNLSELVYADEFQRVYAPLEFRQVLDRGGELKAILRGMPSYADNPRLNIFQLEKYLVDDGAAVTLWYGCFAGGRCMSLAVLKKYRDDGVILLAEVQSAVKGYGQPLIENILSRSRNIWWCADPDGGESLVEYYRRFGVNEYLIRKSKWVGNRPEHAFYKVEDPEHERIILNTLRRADADDSLYTPTRL